MKNCTTPRTLAECQFMTGYRGARIEPRRSLRTYLLTPQSSLCSPDGASFWPGGVDHALRPLRLP